MSPERVNEILRDCISEVASKMKFVQADITCGKCGHRFFLWGKPWEIRHMACPNTDCRAWPLVYTFVPGLPAPIR